MTYRADHFLAYIRNPYMHSRINCGSCIVSQINLFSFPDKVLSTRHNQFISPSAIREEVNEIIGYNQKESTNIFDCQLLLGLALSTAKEMEMKLWAAIVLRELPGYQRTGQEKTGTVWKLVVFTLLQFDWHSCWLL